MLIKFWVLVNNSFTVEKFPAEHTSLILDTYYYAIPIKQKNSVLILKLFRRNLMSSNEFIK